MKSSERRSEKWLSKVVNGDLAGWIEFALANVAIETLNQWMISQKVIHNKPRRCRLANILVAAQQNHWPIRLHVLVPLRNLTPKWRLKSKTTTNLIDLVINQNL